MTEIDEIELIKKHYGDFTGLYDPGQAVAHVKLLLAELDIAMSHIERGNHQIDLAWRQVRSIEAECQRAFDIERERILGTPDEPTGILDRYEIKAYTAPNGQAMHMVYCGRCHHVQVTVRDLEGDQSGVTLAELAEWAMDHEDEEHGGEDHAAAESSSPVEATNA